MRLGPKGGKGRGGARRTVRVDDGLVELARQDKVQREGHLLQRHRDRRGQHHQVGAAALDHVEAHRIGGVVHGAVDEEQQRDPEGALLCRGARVVVVACPHEDH